MTDPFLHVDGLHMAYGHVIAVDHVSIEIPKGEFLTFLGPSGSGKSTTLYAIAGLLEPTGGDIRLEGRSILKTPPHRRNMGMVFQRYTLFPHLTVAENVAFPLRVRGRPGAEIDARVKAMLALVRLEKFADRLPAKLSGGQQQRVALARALAYDPPVLLMDEPLSALDKKLREEIQVEIRRIHRETGVTILYVTHDQEEALRLSDRIALFNAGRIEQIGTCADLYARPDSHFVAAFIGDSNFLSGTIETVDGPMASVILPDGSRRRGTLGRGAKAGPGMAAELMVRPRRVVVAEDGLPVKIDDCTFLGDDLVIQAESAWGQELWFRAPLALASRFTPGTIARVNWAEDDALVFPAPAV